MTIKHIIGLLFTLFLFLPCFANAASFQYGGLRLDANSTASSAGTLTLTYLSRQIQRITGTTTETVQLPSASTLSVGYWYRVENSSTGVVTVKDGSGATIATLNAGGVGQFDLHNAGSAAGTWFVGKFGNVAASDLTNGVTGSGSVVLATSPSFSSPTVDVFTMVQQSTPGNPSTAMDKLYFKSDDNLYYLTSGGVETKVGTGSGGGGLNARFTLSGAIVQFTAIDGAHYQAGTLSLTAVNLSCLNSGSSGSTVFQVNQYRSGALHASATASLSASSSAPAGSAASLSGTLSLLAGDVITVDINSGATGASDCSLEY